MEIAATGEPVWLVEQRRKGETLVVRETGRSVEKFSKTALIEVLRDETYARPPRIYRQDKATLVAEVQRWVTSERCGASILANLKRLAAKEA
jgi:hypothetical protein